MVVLATVLFTRRTMRYVGYVSPELLLLSAVCTMAAYSYQRAIFMVYFKPIMTNIRQHWYISHKKFLFFCVIISLFIILVLFQKLVDLQKIIFAFTVLVSTLYVVPNKKFKGFRHLSYFKPFAIALSWVLLTTALPLASNFFSKKGLVLIGNHFVIVFIAALLFDVRDIQEDRSEGLKTFANQMPLATLKLVCYGLLILRMSLLIEVNEVISELIFSIILGLLVYLTRPTRADYFYLFVIDGSLVLYPIVMLI